MQEKHKYLVVESSVLPEVFLKVIEAKELIANNIAKNSSHACELVGLSRSTFYRYKNCVEPLDTEKSKTMTLYLSLKDKPGVLASVLDVLRNAGVNVLTINQNIPVNSVAPVCLTLRDNSEKTNIYNAIELIKNLEGVVNIKYVNF